MTDSLSEVLGRADQRLADTLLASAETWVKGWEDRKAEITRKYHAAKAAGHDVEALAAEFTGWRDDLDRAHDLLSRLDGLLMPAPKEDEAPF